MLGDQTPTQVEVELAAVVAHFVYMGQNAKRGSSG
jgi:hypothetical protein